MTIPNWYKLFDVEYDIDKLLVWARRLQLSKPSILASSEYFGKHQQYWASEFPQDMFDYFNQIIPLDGSHQGTNTSSFLWEYTQHTYLTPHIHEHEENVASVLIIPLIGKFKTNLILNDKVADSVIYGPGKACFLKGQKYKHSGEAIDGYRLAALLYIKKGTDLDSYTK